MSLIQVATKCIYLAKLGHFTNLDFPEIAEISLPKGYILRWKNVRGWYVDQIYILRLKSNVSNDILPGELRNVHTPWKSKLPPVFWSWNFNPLKNMKSTNLSIPRITTQTTNQRLVDPKTAKNNVVFTYMWVYLPTLAESFFNTPKKQQKNPPFFGCFRVPRPARPTSITSSGGSIKLWAFSAKAACHDQRRLNRGVVVFGRFRAPVFFCFNKVC